MWKTYPHINVENFLCEIRVKFYCRNIAGYITAILLAISVSGDLSTENVNKSEL